MLEFVSVEQTASGSPRERKSFYLFISINPLKIYNLLFVRKGRMLYYVTVFMNIPASRISWTLPFKCHSSFLSLSIFLIHSCREYGPERTCLNKVESLLIVNRVSFIRTKTWCQKFSRTTSGFPASSV